MDSDATTIAVHVTCGAKNLMWLGLPDSQSRNTGDLSLVQFSQYLVFSECVYSLWLREYVNLDCSSFGLCM